MTGLSKELKLILLIGKERKEPPKPSLVDVREGVHFP